MQVIINPGSGPVEGATEDEARNNIKHLITDSKVKGVHIVRSRRFDDGQGRFAFLLWKDNCCTLVEMPGVPLDRVRFVGSEGQNIWNFPRLYLDGSSWIWNIAADIVADILTNKHYREMEEKLEALENGGA